jgi:hypothetical protein
MIHLYAVRPTLARLVEVMGGEHGHRDRRDGLALDDGKTSIALHERTRCFRVEAPGAPFALVEVAGLSKTVVTVRRRFETTLPTTVDTVGKALDQLSNGGRSNPAMGVLAKVLTAMAPSMPTALWRDVHSTAESKVLVHHGDVVKVSTMEKAS